jgi:7,8-dihydroneopterin aldolase/epimerase/oxygenase
MESFPFSNHSQTRDAILLEGMQVEALVGVPDAERSKPQRLEISIRMHLSLAVASSSDDLNHTIDYAAIQQRVIQIVSAEPYRLIETVAGRIASELLKEYPLVQIDVEVRKFILPSTRHVAVRISRSASL